MSRAEAEAQYLRTTGSTPPPKWEPTWEYGLAYGNDMGGTKIGPEIWIEVTPEWDDLSHISEAGTYYRRAVGTQTWERIPRD